MQSYGTVDSPIREHLATERFKREKIKVAKLAEAPYWDIWTSEKKTQSMK